MVESISKSYKPWIIASLVVLIGSLGVLAVAMTVAFIYFSGVPQPVWLSLLGVLGGLGVAAGFGGFFLLMLVAGYSAWREGRRVQVLPPEQ